MATTPSPRQNFWQTWLNSLSSVAPPSANNAGLMFTSFPLGSFSMNVSSRVFLISSATRSMAHSSSRSEEHTSELQSRLHLVCRLLLEKKKKDTYNIIMTHYKRATARHSY